VPIVYKTVFQTDPKDPRKSKDELNKCPQVALSQWGKTGRGHSNIKGISTVLETHTGSLGHRERAPNTCGFKEAFWEEVTPEMNLTSGVNPWGDT
jgi:hypothetical protein